MADRVTVQALPGTMGEVIVWVMTYARSHPDNFVIGPFDSGIVVKSGLELLGEIDNVVPALVKRFGEKVRVTDG